MPRPTEAELQGFEKRETVEVDARVWQGLRRQLIRLTIGWRYADKEIARILESCQHASGCVAVEDRTRPCLPECPDREKWLSALVIKHNAELYSAIYRSLPLRPDSDYRPPSRETYDAVVSELEMMREAGDLLGQVEASGPIPSPWSDTLSIVSATDEKPVSRLVPAGQEDDADTEPPPPPSRSESDDELDTPTEYDP